MKFSVNKSDIKDILSHVQGITGRKSNLAITANILIKTTGSGIIISATDLETGFEGFYPAQIEVDGMIAVNARKVFEMVQNFSSEEIIFSESENRRIKIINNNVEFLIVGMNPDDFPVIPKIEDVTFFDIDAYQFKKMIERTIMIAPEGNEEKREHILGVWFETVITETQKIVRMVSTDNKRLSKIDYICEYHENIPEIKNILIPKKGLNEVNKFIDPEGIIQIGIKDNHFVVKKDNETINVGLLEGEFPDYNDIIDYEDYHTVDISRELFYKMLKRMSILYSDDYKSVVFNFDQDKLLIIASNPDLGESKEDILINYYGTPFKVAFNPKYFIDTLNTLDEDNIIIRIFDEESPCFIQEKEDVNFVSVIMPMKI